MGLAHHLCQNPRSGFNHLFSSPSFLSKLKAQRSGFQFEATNQHTGEETRLRVFEHCVLREELVTRTGFEPMLKA